MDSDASNNAATLQSALAALRQRFGQQLGGAQHHGEAQMRGVVMDALGLDEATADRVVKKLAQTGQLAYQGTREVGTEPGTSTTGPVISMPGTTVSAGVGEFVTTANPSMLMGTVNNPGGGDVGAAQAGAPSSGEAVSPMGAVSADPIRGGDAGRTVAVNNQGATMGQLDDTNVEARPQPITVGEREEIDNDRTEGFWRIG